MVTSHQQSIVCSKFLLSHNTTVKPRVSRKRLGFAHSGHIDNRLRALWCQHQKYHPGSNLEARFGAYSPGGGLKKVKSTGVDLRKVRFASQSPPGWRGTLVPSSLLLSSLELSDTEVYEPSIRARLGTAAHFCEVPLGRREELPPPVQERHMRPP